MSNTCTYMRDLLSPIREYHHHQHRRHCPLVGWNKSFVSILARISVAAALLPPPARARSPPLPKLRSSPRRKGIRVRRPTDRRMPTPYNYLAAAAADTSTCLFRTPQVLSSVRVRRRRRSLTCRVSKQASNPTHYISTPFSHGLSLSLAIALFGSEWCRCSAAAMAAADLIRVIYSF